MTGAAPDIEAGVYFRRSTSRGRYFTHVLVRSWLALKHLSKNAARLISLIYPWQAAKPLYQIEDLPSGYPQFTALIASHPSFQVCRRFSVVRNRLLLLKQDRLTRLEEELSSIDVEEQCVLFLGNARRDTNRRRKAVLEELDTALSDYDGFISRAFTTQSYDHADVEAVSGLRRWHDQTGSIERSERSFLQHGEDLAAIGTPTDSALRRLENWLEAKVLHYYESFRESPYFGISRNPNVHVYSGMMFKAAAQFLIVCLIVLLLAVPAAILSNVSNVVIRILVVSLSAASFIMTLSSVSKVKPSEMFLAGTTYAAVLIVFVTGPSD